MTPESEPMPPAEEVQPMPMAEPVPPIPPVPPVSAPLPPRPVRASSSRRRYLLAMSALFVLLIALADRAYDYASRAKQIYYSPSPASSQGISTGEPVQNQIQPLSNTSSPASGSSVSSSPASPASHAPANPFASVTALSYLVGNVKTGQIYFSHDMNQVMPIASLSKLTTALVARQFMNQSQIVPITQQVMDVYSDAYGIELGENFTVAELYYPMLLQSNDNAAAAFAYAYGAVASATPGTSGIGGTVSPPIQISGTASSTDTAFVNLMNEYVGELGMTQSHFLDSSGLSEGNVSTASDLFILAQFLYADKFNDKLFTPNIFAITTLPSESVSTTTEHFAHDFVNINPFVGNPAFVGGKTGRTNAAGETMLSIFNYDDSEGQTDPIVVIVLHSDYGTRQADTEKLLNIAENGIAAGKY